jgi:hypothetical protein
MAAYELVDYASLQDALVTATRYPMAKAAMIKVRPIWDDLARRASSKTA